MHYLNPEQGVPKRVWQIKDSPSDSSNPFFSETWEPLFTFYLSRHLAIFIQKDDDQCERAISYISHILTYYKKFYIDTKKLCLAIVFAT